MHVSLVSTLPTSPARPADRLADALRGLGHDVRVVDRPDLDPSGAAALGYGLADSWDGAAPDVVVALGWLAGLAAQVATRERSVPVLLRLPRPGRSGDLAVTRVERALVRSGATLLAAAPSEAEALAVMGAARTRVRVLPETVDVATVARRDEGDPAGADVVVVADDTPEGVAALLEAMAAGRPAVVVDRGVLADLVADGVSGIVVPSPDDLALTARALQTDRMRCEAMGMAAADRVQACFDISVVRPLLGRLLDEATRSALSPV
jgi:glycosyltransferase involved in cell wall biosynthesis